MHLDIFSNNQRATASRHLPCDDLSRRQNGTEATFFDHLERRMYPMSSVHRCSPFYSMMTDQYRVLRCSIDWNSLPKHHRPRWIELEYHLVNLLGFPLLSTLIINIIKQEHKHMCLLYTYPLHRLYWSLNKCGWCDVKLIIRQVRTNVCLFIFQ